MLDLVDFASDKNMQQFCFIPKLGKAMIAPAVMFIVVFVVVIIILFVVVIVFVLNDQPWSQSRRRKGTRQLLQNLRASQPAQLKGLPECPVDQPANQA